MTNDSHYDNITVGPEDYDISIKGLRKYTAYVVQVAGFNQKGEGAPSKAILITTDQDGEYVFIYRFFFYSIH